MLDLTNLAAVLQAKIAGLAPGADDKAVLLLTKAIESAIGRIGIADIEAATAEALADIAALKTSGTNAVGTATTNGTATIGGAITAGIAQINTALAQPHSHTVSQVTGLQTALDAKLAQGKHTIWIPAGSMTPRATNGASVAALERSNNKLMLRTLDFDAGVQEHAQFAVAMPKSWNEGTLSYQALWMGDGTGGVAWSLQGVAMGDIDSLDAGFGTAVQVTDAWASSGSVHITVESGAVTVAGPPAEGDLVFFQVFRAVADAADTMPVDAKLIGIRLYFTLAAGNDA